MCQYILEINVKIAYEIKKSDKLYILKENIEALLKDKQKQIDYEFEDRFNDERFFEKFKQIIS